MKKYPRLVEMPYYQTTISPEQTQGDILVLLKKYGVKEHQWTVYGGRATLKFMIETIVQGRQIKAAVQMEIPEIKALFGQKNEIRIVPKKIVFRLFWHNLKALLESTKYGIIKKEDIFFSYILTQLPDGSQKSIKDLFLDSGKLLLAEAGVLDYESQTD